VTWGAAGSAIRLLETALSSRDPWQMKEWASGNPPSLNPVMNGEKTDFKSLCINIIKSMQKIDEQLLQLEIV